MGFKSLCLNRSGAIRAKIFLMFLEKMPDMAEKLPNIKIRIYDHRKTDVQNELNA